MMAKESPMTLGKMVAQKNDDGGRAERLQICDSFEKCNTFRDFTAVLYTNHVL